MDRDDIEREQLGELNVELRRERGDLFQRRAGEDTGGPSLPTPHDVLQQNRDVGRAGDAPALRGRQVFGVTSTYPALPINATRWVHRGAVVLQPNEDPGVNEGISTFTVPAGRVAVVRRISWTVDNVLRLSSLIGSSPLGQSPFAGQLRIEKAVPPTYTAVPNQQADLEVFAIADEGREISLFFGVQAGAFPSDWEAIVQVTMTGDLLRNTGREKQYEIANSHLPGSAE